MWSSECDVLICKELKHESKNCVVIAFTVTVGTETWKQQLSNILYGRLQKEVDSVLKNMQDLYWYAQQTSPFADTKQRKASWRHVVLWGHGSSLLWAPHCWDLLNRSFQCTSRWHVTDGMVLFILFHSYSTFCCHCPWLLLQWLGIPADLIALGERFVFQMYSWLCQHQ